MRLAYPSNVQGKWTNFPNLSSAVCSYYRFLLERYRIYFVSYTLRYRYHTHNTGTVHYDCVLIYKIRTEPRQRSKIQIAARKPLYLSHH